MSQPPVLYGDRPLELAAFDQPASRVRPAPQRLPQRRRDGPGPNRFDDPDHVYVVRYLADSLRPSLLEAMARLRLESRENEQWRH